MCGTRLWTLHMSQGKHGIIFDFWIKRNPSSCGGWKMNSISEQCANNATMCHNLSRRKFQQQLMDNTKSAILTLYRLQLHFCFFLGNVNDIKCYKCI